MNRYERPECEVLTLRAERDMLVGGSTESLTGSTGTWDEEE